MDIRPVLGIAPRRELTLTPRLRQALRVLQMPAMELAAHIRAELGENPFLDEAPEDFALAEQTPGGSLEIGGDDATRPAGIAAPPASASAALQSSSVGSSDGWAGWTGPASAAAFAAVATSSEGWDDGARMARTLAAVEPWQARIAREFRLRSRSAQEMRTAEYLIGCLDGRGYLVAPAEEIAAATETSVDEVERIRQHVMRLDPPGLGARDLRECLLVQLECRHPGDRLATRIVAEGLESLARGRYAALAKRLHVNLGAIRAAAARIRRLWPHPASALGGEGAPPVFPDVVVERGDEGHWAVLAPGHIPRLRIIPPPAELPGDAEARDFVATRLTRARWLLASIDARRRTLLAVTRLVIAEQEDFLTRGIEQLKPLSLRQAAERLGMHESTVARAVRGKYVQTPRGVLALRFFFAKGLSGRDGRPRAAPAVARRIRELIAEEDRACPLTDSAIAGRLRREGVRIARRTVAKYRDRMRVPPAGFRRRE